MTDNDPIRVEEGLYEEACSARGCTKPAAFRVRGDHVRATPPPTSGPYLARATTLSNYCCADHRAIADDYCRRVLESLHRRS